MVWGRTLSTGVARHRHCGRQSHSQFCLRARLGSSSCAAMRRCTKRRLDPDPPPDSEESETSAREDVDGRGRPEFSVFASMLLREWSRGKLYGAEVQRYALAAFKDGLTSYSE
eukprot:8494274-Pyramimonas_sp.AAC.1